MIRTKPTGIQLRISIDKTLILRFIAATAQVVQPRFLIEDISTIAEGVAYTERVSERAGCGERLAPCIVLVFYNEFASAVKDSHGVSLKIVEVGADRFVESYLCGAGFWRLDAELYADLSVQFVVMEGICYVRRGVAGVGLELLIRYDKPI